MTSISVSSLSLTLDDKVILDNITSTFDSAHGIYAIIGPSGCGKTSFLNCLNRLIDLIPSARVSGNICLDDIDIYHSKTDLLNLRRNICMIFQKPNPLPMSIRKNFTLPLSEVGIKNKAMQEEIIEETLTSVGLWDDVKDSLNKPATALSGGQQQRLCFARGLSLRPKVLLLDEPCSALDPLSTEHIENLILDLAQEYLIIIVTHNLAQARRIADHTSLFWLGKNGGTIIEARETSEFFSAPIHPTSKMYIEGLKG